jgi:subtilisin family serine protease
VVAAPQRTRASRFRAEARREGVSYAERGDFSTLWNGLSVRAGPPDVAGLRGLDSVTAVFPMAVIQRTTATSGDPSPELETALGMTGGDTAHDIGFTGQGFSIAVVDTGIDYNHPDLGASGDETVTYTAQSEENRTLIDENGDPHPRISHGWDYVGGEFDASDPESPPPEPYPNPMDTNGHGTHVTGIAGADAASTDGVTGLAPRATLGAYKVFAEGSTTADIIVEALEDAFEDGMDIVNMSLGASLTWGQEYPTTAASNELANQGVVVVNSAGNDGGLGMWSLSAPANAHDIISVASAENVSFPARTFEVAQLTDPVPFTEFFGDNVVTPPTSGVSAPLALPAQSTIGGETGYFGCDPADFEDFPDGHVALIERGTCFFSEKYTNAVDAGASGVVIYNNEPGLFFGFMRDAGVPGHWSAVISNSSGRTLVDLVTAGEEVRLTFTDDTVHVPNPSGRLLSPFTSYGQDVELAFGPSLTAPGGFVTSTYPLEKDGYATLSGTSMSAPHVAGATALLLEAEPNLTPFDVRDRLQNTSEPALWSLAPFPGLVEHTFRQGAGMLQIDRSIVAEQWVTPAQIGLGERPSANVTLTLTNDGDQDITYTIDHQGTIDLGVNTYAPIPFLPGGSVDAPASVTVPAHGSAEVDVTVSAPGFGLPDYQYGGYIVMTPDAGGLDTLRVPYSGYDGDYQELDLFGYYTFTSEGLEFVEIPSRLSRIVYDDEGEFDGFEPVEAGYEFTLRDDGPPVLEAFFGHFPQTMRMWAVHQESGKEWLVLDERFLPRTPEADTFLPFVWDGMTPAGRSENRRPVASGTYTLRFEVLRTLADPDVPEYLQTFESEPFVLDARPARGRPSLTDPPVAGSTGGD